MASSKLKKIPSMRERVEDTLSAHRNELVALLSRYTLFFFLKKKTNFTTLWQKDEFNLIQIFLFFCACDFGYFFPFSISFSLFNLIFFGF